MATKLHYAFLGKTNFVKLPTGFGNLCCNTRLIFLQQEPLIHHGWTRLFNWLEKEVYSKNHGCGSFWSWPGSRDNKEESTYILFRLLSKYRFRIRPSDPVKNRWKKLHSLYHFFLFYSYKKKVNPIVQKTRSRIKKLAPNIFLS